MSNQASKLTTPPEDQSIVLGAFGKSRELVFNMETTIEAMHRLIEAKTVNPVTYSDLEYCFNVAYRDLRRYLSQIGYEITKTDKAMEEAKATVLLDKYPDFMKDRPKSQDNADMRKAFLIRDVEYSDALDRMNQLKALESNFEGRIRVLENVSRYMKKEMDLLLRSGLTGKNLY